MVWGTGSFCNDWVGTTERANIRRETSVAVHGNILAKKRGGRGGPEVCLWFLLRFCLGSLKNLTEGE